VSCGGIRLSLPDGGVAAGTTSLSEALTGVVAVSLLLTGSTPPVRGRDVDGLRTTSVTLSDDLSATLTH
jgi:hypothetical protein